MSEDLNFTRWRMAVEHTSAVCLAYERQLTDLRQQLAAANERADKAEATLTASTP